MDIAKLTLAQIHKLVDSHKVTLQEVNKFYIDRATKLNQHLNAYLQIATAASPDKLQIAIKDNFCMKGVRTTASSNMLKNFVPGYDSTATKRLEESGYSNLGKTNMDAFAHGSSTETSDFGTTLNPWSLQTVPGGSSGGSAAAVASGLAPAALGSETAGSIRLPASWCGIVGLKPTYGRVSRYGVVAMGSSFDCPGPMCKTVEDCAILLQSIAGQDPLDATTLAHEVPNYSSFLKNTTKYKIGVPKEYLQGLDAELLKSFEDSLTILKKLGHEVTYTSLLDPKYSISVYTILQRAEVSSNLARLDGVRYGETRDNFGVEAKRRIALGTHTLSQGYLDEYYNKAQKVRAVIMQDFRRAFTQFDVLVAPTTPTTAIPVGESANYPFFGELMDRLAEPSALAGLPALSLPSGITASGMPIGLQFIAPHLAEGTILALAHMFEQEIDAYNSIVLQGITKFEAQL